MSWQPGDQVQLYMPRATVVTAGPAGMQVTLPGSREHIWLPLLNEQGDPVTRVYAAAPDIRPGEVYEAENGTRLFVFDGGSDPQVGALALLDEGGRYWTPQDAACYFGWLHRADEPLERSEPALVRGYVQAGAPVLMDDPANADAGQAATAMIPAVLPDAGLGSVTATSVMERIDPLDPRWGDDR